MTTPDGNRTARGWLAFLAALLLLNASLSFENVWPTPAIWWRGRLSIELALSLLLLALAHRAVNRSPAKWLRGVAVIWLLLVFGRYGDVTAPALYGRDINLYWDARFMPDVAAMVVRVVPWWQIVLAVAFVLLGLFWLYRLSRWSFSQITTRLATPGGRRIVGLTGAAMVTWFVVQRMELPYTEYPWFTRSVVSTYARQAWLAFTALTTTARLAPSPPMNADLSLVAGTDVLLVFAESYGSVSFDRPEFAGQLADRRLALERASADTNRQIVSTFVESTTFGGSSWLAHISLLSGVEVRDHDSNALLMSENRETMAAVFKRHGYRTIAFMPGLRSPWPEGSFYGFDQTYNAERLQYPGPDFGWFAVPDQFSLAWLDATEIVRAPRPPLFVFFPTLSTHFPFSPTPPYQEDWPRILSEHKFSAAQIVDAYGEQLDWDNFGPSYVKAVAYMYETIAGYLKLRGERDFVMILVGDHQPPAAVSGEGASWDVPMHVITGRQPILDRLQALGFSRGLEPRRRPPLGRMDELLPVLLNGFSRHE